MSLPNLSRLTHATGVVMGQFNRASTNRLQLELKDKIKPDDLQDGPTARNEACAYCMAPLNGPSLVDPKSTAVVAAVQGPNACGHVCHLNCIQYILRTTGKADCPTCSKPIDAINWQTQLADVPAQPDAALTNSELQRMVQTARKKARETILDEDDAAFADRALRRVARLNPVVAT